jgi:mono/diheme cytochrome c family protein
MRPLSLTTVALLLAAGLVGSCAGVQLPKEKLQEPGGLLFNGYTKPEINCHRCHNGDGTGTLRGPNLAKKVPTESDSQLTETIQKGKGLMPAFQEQLSPDQLAQLLGWLRARFPAVATP